MRRASWLKRSLLGSVIIITVAGLQLGATAIVQDEVPTTPPNQRAFKDSPVYVKGQLIVKYKETVTECVHCLLKTHQSFKSATTDSSDSLDRLHAKHQVKSARPIFRTEEEEAQIRGKAAQAPLVLLQQHHRAHLEASKAKFPHRTKRASQEATIPALYHLYLLEVPEETDLETAVMEFTHDPHVAGGLGPSGLACSSASRKYPCLLKIFSLGLDNACRNQA